LYRIPALGDSLLRPFEGAIESFNCLFGAPGEYVASCLKPEHQPVKTLQQRIVQCAGDERALVQARVELLGDLLKAETVCEP